MVTLAVPESRHFEIRNIRLHSTPYKAIVNVLSMRLVEEGFTCVFKPSKSSIQLLHLRRNGRLLTRDDFTLLQRIIRFALRDKLNLEAQIWNPMLAPGGP